MEGAGTAKIAEGEEAGRTGAIQVARPQMRTTSALTLA